MLAFILFAAVLHLALGYGLAIYLGYAPLAPAGTESAASLSFASVVDDEDIVIADESLDDSNDGLVDSSADTPAEWIENPDFHVGVAVHRN